MSKEIRCSRCGKHIGKDDIYFTERVFLMPRKFCPKCRTERLLRKCAVDEIMSAVMFTLMAVIALGSFVVFFIIALSCN